MRKLLLFVIGAMACSACLYSQNVFNPSDPIVRYDRTKALGSSQNPNIDIRGLQKFVSTATNGVSTGTDAYNASSFKAYLLNVNGVKLAFRIKFPYSYSRPEGASKKYPVMLFLHGAGETGCPTNGNIYNNEKQLWLGGNLFMQRVDNNQFDGFLVYPQLVAGSDCWGIWGQTAIANLSLVVSMIDSMVKYVRADIDRLLITGLSGGGYGAWRMADNFPHRVAKIMPSAAAGSTTNRTAFVHIPNWFATGGKDPDPSPAQAQYSLTRMKEIGADIRYTSYPDLGHAVWNTHWKEPDFIAGMNDVHKANPLIFFQKSEYCAGESINAKIGITQSFYAYEWQKDNITIATRTNGVNTIVNGASIISFTGNEITVRSFGTYRVRFKRFGGSAWSDWSPKPAVIKAKVVAAAPPIMVVGVKSKVLPATDGSTTVPLQMPSGFINYDWVRVSDNVKVSSAQTYNAPAGVYKAKYDESPGCGPSYSPEFTVVNANGSPKPDAATNPTSSTLSSTSARVSWTQNANETGFEIYRSTVSGGPYQFIALTAADVATYQDNSLAANTTYYYVIRAVNGTGAAAVSPQTSPNGGNLAPVITLASNITAQTDMTSNTDFTITDVPGDVVTVTTPYKPAFMTLQNSGNGNYRLVLNPTSENIGLTDVKIVATDQNGMFSTKVISILVTDKNTRSVFVNFGSNGKTAPAPWNNWLGNRGANNVLSNLKDENNATTSFSITTVTAWSTTTNFGHLTGNNSGVAPDAVLQSGIADNGASKQIVIGGLNPSKKYNLEFIGSQNEGMIATTEYAVGTVKSVLNATYNTQQSANLNGLVPSASGQISVTATRTGASLFTYLNGLIIEEYDASVTLMAPLNLYAEAQDRNNVMLTWCDRAKTASAAVTYEIQRATDSLFTQNATTISIAFNTSYKNTGLSNNTKYWYRVRAKLGSSYSPYSNRMAAITPSALVYINFNTTIAGSPSPWNNLNASPMSPFTISNLNNNSGSMTFVSITLDQVFNGEFTAGMNTGNNSGMVPDNVMRSDYWLDKSQVAQFTISGLNKTRKYRFGFFGSSSPVGWFSGNYTATYSINDRIVYLNSWQNSTKIVYIGDVTPDANGKVALKFSTTPEADWGFNGGVILSEYVDAQGGTAMNSVLENVVDSMVTVADPSSISIYPNPFDDVVKIDFYNSSVGNDITTEIYDISGRIVYRNNHQQLSPGRNILTMKLNERRLIKGIYLVALKVNGKIMQSQKLLKK